MTAPISQKDFPMLTDMATLSVVEGSIEFFRNGTVRLGGTDIPWHCDLVDYEFSGAQQTAEKKVSLRLARPLGPALAIATTE